MHFDVMVEDVASATPYVIDLGATELADDGSSPTRPAIRSA